MPKSLVKPSRLSFLLAAPLVAALVSNPASAQNLFSGVWSPGTGAHAAWITSDWNSFTTKWSELERDGLLMDDFEVYLEGSTPVYVGLFRAGTGGRAAYIVTDWDDFTSKWSQFERDGLRMHDFETYVIDGVRWYAGIFHAGTDGRAAYIVSDWNDFTSKWGQFEKDGLRMHDFETYVDHGVRWYVGIFREGTGGYAAWFTGDWNDFINKWNELDAVGLRLVDFEFFEDGGNWTYGGIFRPGTGGHYGWFGVDWENFRSFWHEREKEGYILDDIEIFPTSCSNVCMNQLILPAPDYYDYGITRTATHCPGLPNTCSVPGDDVPYRAPFYEEGGERFVKLSAVMNIDSIFTLPFTDQGMHHNGWLYEPGKWHHAVDYYNGSTFNVRAAAPGRVIHVGWDWWSGNTVVVSHDVGADKDRYRTIYMHLRNGASNDCAKSWGTTLPILQNSSDPGLQAVYPNYKDYLTSTSCNKNGSGTPMAQWWGDDNDVIQVSPGELVDRGQILAKAGCTGPGGCGCADGGSGPNTHLHIFFAHRDPTNNEWYTFDPYGIYGPAECYPSRNDADGDPASSACTRYPVAWLDGFPQLPTPPTTTKSFKRGDANGDGKLDISDAINLLGCKFQGLPCPRCEDAADSNADGRVDLSDAVFELNCLFQRQCPDLDGTRCLSERPRLGCRQYDACRGIAAGNGNN